MIRDEKTFLDANTSLAVTSSVSNLPKFEASHRFASDRLLVSSSLKTYIYFYLFFPAVKE